MSPGDFCQSKSGSGTCTVCLNNQNVFKFSVILRTKFVSHNGSCGSLPRPPTSVVWNKCECKSIRIRVLKGYHIPHCCCEHPDKHPERVGRLPALRGMSYVREISLLKLRERRQVAQWMLGVAAGRTSFSGGYKNVRSTFTYLFEMLLRLTL